MGRCHSGGQNASVLFMEQGQLGQDLQYNQQSEDTNEYILSSLETEKGKPNLNLFFLKKKI